MEAEELRRYAAGWKNSFGAGMIAFDDAYFPALKRGATGAEASREGAHAMLDKFVESVIAAEREAEK